MYNICILYITIKLRETLRIFVATESAYAYRYMYIGAGRKTLVHKAAGKFPAIFMSVSRKMQSLRMVYNNYLIHFFFLSSFFFLCLAFKKARKINVSAT